ncbi:hypothetical protein PAL_GLEAN10001825 [Pteropus alecto]|uniref:Uncharacterized protein n=1 Tax=Pteropus alecto TaxID=9402 RepID=L5L7H8_PTEAL|nr:hypothetical protein PAL_GLEAN10001825 [Pteropus alecto]
MPRFTAGAGCGACSAHSSPALPTPQHGARKLQPTPQSSPNAENVLTLQYVPGLHAAWSHEHNVLVTPETQPRQGGTQNGRNPERASPLPARCLTAQQLWAQKIPMLRPKLSPWTANLGLLPSPAVTRVELLAKEPGVWGDVCQSSVSPPFSPTK